MFAGAYTAKERVQWPIRKRRARKKKKEKTGKEKKIVIHSEGFLKEQFADTQSVSSFNATEGRSK